MFADNYIQRNNYSSLIGELPHPELGMVIVIPCLREPEILNTLKSVLNCKQPDCCVEVIVLINHPESAPNDIKEQNRQTRQELDEWIRNHSSHRLKFHAIGPVPLRKKWAGAGLARKHGMDEAVFRFNLMNKPQGIIVSLDADTLVEENYLIEIENYFSQNPSVAGATLRFKHQTEGLSERHLQGISLYEQYMEYYKQALDFSGYPFPMFTLGSAFAVRAGAYVKRGGMNRRKAGEDFYFLQNLVQVGRVGEINSTTVHPSSRLSDRVPFGTGPVLQRWMAGQEDITKTYKFDAFSDLKVFFDVAGKLYQIAPDEYENLLAKLPVPVAAFLKEVDFLSELNELNRNCATPSSFRLRFYHRFNAFKILKFLNFTHGVYYEKADLAVQMNQLNNKLKI